MKKSNFALRLQPSLMDASRRLAEREGVALNQLFNVAVAQMISAYATAEYFEERSKRADVAKALAILHRPRKGERPRPGDELPDGRTRQNGGAKSAPKPRGVIRSKSPK